MAENEEDITENEDSQMAENQENQMPEIEEVLMSENEDNQMTENEDSQMAENQEVWEPSKILTTSEDWEWYLRIVKIRKEDMNRLVMNFLVVEGYREAAENFQKESGTKPEVDFASITDRLAVKESIQSGNLEDATDKLNALNPEILKTNFHLKLQRLIELIRKETTTPDEALAFAEFELELKPFGKQNKAFLEEIEKTLTLLCVKDPSTCPAKELLENSQRFKTADEVNAAILTSQTGEKGSQLERLLKMLFWTQDQLDEKAVYPRMSVSTGQLTVINPSE